METLKEKIDKSKTYSQAEYARKMGVSQQLVYYWVKKGKVKTIKVRGVTLIVE
jgi:transposase-like protein